MSEQRNVLLVGSVGLDDAESVFRTLGDTVGGLAQRFPDGELRRDQRCHRRPKAYRYCRPNSWPHRSQNDGTALHSSTAVARVQSLGAVFERA